jgi:hypothetical protein
VVIRLEPGDRQKFCKPIDSTQRGADFRQRLVPGNWQVSISRLIVDHRVGETPFILKVKFRLRSSLSAPRATIRSPSSANGRCSAFASSHGARIQTSRSSSLVRITGMAFGWIGSTTAFGAVVRKP